MKNDKSTINLTDRVCQILRTNTLKFKAKDRYFLWQERQKIAHLVPTEIAWAVFETSSPDVQSTSLSSHYQSFASVNGEKNLIGMYFCIKIKVAQNDVNTALSLAQSMLEKHPKLKNYQTLRDINNVCTDYAFQLLKEYQPVPSGHYLLYLAQQPSQHKQALNLAIKAILTNHYPSQKDGLQFMLDSKFEQEAKVDDTVSVIKMAMTLLKSDQYTSQLHEVLDRFKLTALFQKPSSDYLPTHFVTSYVKRSSHDLTCVFAEAITNDEDLISIQSQDCKRFFEGFEFNHANTAIKTLYDRSHSRLDQHSAWLVRKY